MVFSGNSLLVWPDSSVFFQTSVLSICVTSLWYNDFTLKWAWQYWWYLQSIDEKSKQKRNIRSRPSFNRTIHILTIFLFEQCISSAKCLRVWIYVSHLSKQVIIAPSFCGIQCIPHAFFGLQSWLFLSNTCLYILFNSHS